MLPRHLLACQCARGKSLDIKSLQEQKMISTGMRLITAPVIVMFH